MSEPTGIGRNLAERVVFALTLALVFWLPLPWGSHRTWSSDLLVVLASTLLALQLLLVATGTARLGPQLRRLLPAPLLWWFVWLLLIGATLLPLDFEQLRSWSPHAAVIHEQAASILDAPVTPRISVSPSATGDALLLSGGYACLYLLVMLCCTGDAARQRKVLGVLAISGVVQATYAGLMLLSGLEWGFFAEKTAYRGVATGTFVNRNHLANYLAITGGATLALILADLGPASGVRGLRGHLLNLVDMLFSAKMRARLSLVILVIALILTRSRMGNTAFFASLGVAGLAFVLLRHRRYALRALLLFASIVLIDVLIVSNWYGLERVVDRIEQTDLQTENRSGLLRDAMGTLDAYAITGSGLGTFSQAHAPFRSAASPTFFDHAHNDYVQFLIETGVAGLFLLALFVGGHALHAVRVMVQRKSALPAAIGVGALMAMSAEALHATTDFNLQIPANVASLLVLMALSASCAETSRGRPRQGRTTGRRRRQDAVHSGRTPLERAGSGETHGS